MGTKETVAKGLKKAARILPGVGSYQDKESARESDKALRMALGRRLDDALGKIEWLKTDQAKKGALLRLKDLDDLTRHLEKVSRLLEYAPRGYAPLFAQREVDEDTLGELLERDRSLTDLVSRVEGAVEAMTAERAVPTAEEVEGVRTFLSQIEQRLKDRESFLAGQAS
ncbi:MAG: hypothetical protein JRJ35_13320 [Deltaproteobacteria bacterium]|nr:hypothetical protein [Deltaproteobacteria bacterium]MBW1950575.1 hypothetical protein [Deltaproteobacteria bacterium]MBW2007574.1 hypothetical protein [Deltaproteobacteria bacterium]MBW2101961.1 hypothetical protein [Deltaproteobacteria bacterium]